MSDRIPYDRSSWDILCYYNYELSKKKKSKIEEEYYSYYKKLNSIHLHCEFNLSMLEKLLEKEWAMRTNAMTHTTERSELAITLIDKMITNYQNKKIEIEKQAYQSKKLLASLEATTPIQSILQRERKPREVITLRYLDAELPDIPYNASQPRYLTNEEIQQIKCMEAVEINSPNKTKEAMPPQKDIRVPNLKLLILFGLAVIILAIITQNHY